MDKDCLEGFSPSSDEASLAIWLCYTNFKSTFISLEIDLLRGHIKDRNIFLA